MLDAKQFVANKQYFYDDWIAARRHGVTATQVAKAATKSGFEQAVFDYNSEHVEVDNAYMQFGRDMEPVIARFVHSDHGILPNEWLIRHAEFKHHLATPDGLSPDHLHIAEIKTTGRDWETEAIPIQYRRQVQWQLHVTGADACLFAWLRRFEIDGELAPAWWKPKYLWIERDSEMIESLIDTANRLWERVNNE